MKKIFAFLTFIALCVGLLSGAAGAMWQSGAEVHYDADTGILTWDTLAINNPSIIAYQVSIPGAMFASGYLTEKQRQIDLKTNTDRFGLSGNVSVQFVAYSKTQTGGYGMTYDMSKEINVGDLRFPQLSAPQNITIERKGEKAYNFSWDPVENCSFYYVYMYSKDGWGIGSTGYDGVSRDYDGVEELVRLKILARGDGTNYSGVYSGLITLDPAAIPTITTTELPKALAGVGYSYTLEASSTADVTWSSEDLPEWLQLNSTTGVLYGTPSLENVGETEKFTVKASGGGGFEKKELSVSTASFGIALRDAVGGKRLDYSIVPGYGTGRTQLVIASYSAAGQMKQLWMTTVALSETAAATGESGVFAHREGDSYRAFLLNTSGHSPLTGFASVS